MLFCVYVLLACLHVLHACPYRPGRLEEGIRLLGLELDDCELLCDPGSRI